MLDGFAFSAEICYYFHMNTFERTLLTDIIIRSYTDIFSFWDDAIEAIRTKLETLSEKNLEKECQCLDEYYDALSYAYQDGYREIQQMEESLEKTRETTSISDLALID